MKETILQQISKIEYHYIDKEKLSLDFQQILRLISNQLTELEKIVLQHDFDIYLDKGKFGIHNTIAGGIIFLREPETIEQLKIAFDSNQNRALASVEYASEIRNARNVKYKPNVGKIESIQWNMLGVFPNFNQFSHTIKVVLMAIIGKIIKQICEDNNKNSWFMEYEQPFEILLFLDDKLELKYDVKAF